MRFNCGDSMCAQRWQMTSLTPESQRFNRDVELHSQARHKNMPTTIILIFSVFPPRIVFLQCDTIVNYVQHTYKVCHEHIYMPLPHFTLMVSFFL